MNYELRAKERRIKETKGMIHAAEIGAVLFAIVLAIIHSFPQ